MGERLPYKQDVIGSSPIVPSYRNTPKRNLFGVFCYTCGDLITTGGMDMVKVGIVCAGDREFAPFLPHIEDYKMSEKAMLKVYEGTINGVGVAALFCGVGKTNAATRLVSKLPFAV